mgnify:CR=1 FL=1
MPYYLLKNHNFQVDGTFLAVEGEKLLGIGSASVRSSDDNNPNASGYIHTFIVKKEYRRQGIGSNLLELIEKYIVEKDGR